MSSWLLCRSTFWFIPLIPWYLNLATFSKDWLSFADPLFDLFLSFHDTTTWPHFQRICQLSLYKIIICPTFYGKNSNYTLPCIFYLLKYHNQPTQLVCFNIQTVKLNTTFSIPNWLKFSHNLITGFFQIYKLHMYRNYCDVA